MIKETLSDACMRCFYKTVRREAIGLHYRGLEDHKIINQFTTILIVE